MDSLNISSWMALLPIPFFIFCWLIATFTFSVFCGWRRLAQQFTRLSATPTSARPILWHFCSGPMGDSTLPANFRHILHLEISNNGIGLSLNALFTIGARPLFIPWTHIQHVQQRSVLRYFTFITIQILGYPTQISLMGKAGAALFDAAQQHNIPMAPPKLPRGIARNA
jgi:hypothetical protein